ncbi:ATP-binding protein [bacterium]|nr:ATP-binding protein [candidate division CSSED10-310 bacterium]
MKELSLHILDIIENSTRAGAKNVEIVIEESRKEDYLVIEIIDDGCGMDDQTLTKVLNPFFTTKDVRRVGIGLSMFRQAALRAGGDLTVRSAPSKGTHVTARFKYAHIDRQPMGDMASTITTVLISNPDLEIVYRHAVDGDQFVFDTRVVRSVLGDVTISSPDVARFICDIIRARQNLD